MATADPRNAFRVPGQLCIGPTQNGLLSAFPHGGTSLGLVRDVRVEEEEEVATIDDEARGQVNGVVRGMARYRLGFIVSGWDDDALNAFYRTTTTSAGGYTGARTLLAAQPGVVTAGSALLFSPRDTRHPAVVVLAPVPFARARTLRFGPSDDLEIAVLCWATRDSNGNDIRIDLLEHLSLT